jgi:hypothetical protein
MDNHFCQLRQVGGSAELHEARDLPAGRTGAERVTPSSHGFAAITSIRLRYADREQTVLAIGGSRGEYHLAHVPAVPLLPTWAPSTPPPPTQALPYVIYVISLDHCTSALSPCEPRG